MKENKGITLVALIITIIVMLILVAVSVRLVINSNILGTAKSAGDAQVSEMEKESNLSFSQIEINGKKYETTTDYLNDNAIPDLPEGWTIAERPTGWSDNVTAITDGTNIVPLPKGYEVSKIAGEQTISEGLVVKDKYNNEFVWIPVRATFEPSYNSDGCSEPTTVSDDTQTNLNKYYGTNYYTIEDSDEYKNNSQNTFAYNAHYAEMVASVNKYDGFYIGRYETTFDDNGSIGTKEAYTILVASMVLKEGQNSNDNNNPFYCRWWGLYALNRNANVYGNGNIVQTNMIWGQQYDAMLAQLTYENIDYSAEQVENRTSSGGVSEAGQCFYEYNGETICDVLYNIFDLRRNAYDATAEAGPLNHNVLRGGDLYDNYSIDQRLKTACSRIENYEAIGSRMTLYIK